MGDTKIQFSLSQELADYSFMLIDVIDASGFFLNRWNGALNLRNREFNVLMSRNPANKYEKQNSKFIVKRNVSVAVSVPEQVQSTKTTKKQEKKKTDKKKTDKKKKIPKLKSQRKKAFARSFNHKEKESSSPHLVSLNLVKKKKGKKGKKKRKSKNEKKKSKINALRIQQQRALNLKELELQTLNLDGDSGREKSQKEIKSSETFQKSVDHSKPIENKTQNKQSGLISKNIKQENTFFVSRKSLFELLQIAKSLNSAILSLSIPIEYFKTPTQMEMIIRQFSFLGFKQVVSTPTKAKNFLTLTYSFKKPILKK
eukprot:Anaeramoba_ignava/a349695_247.p2 GENE.a349695_247~~a349695_247.p2  ORF type:complete len:313 (-),score=103.15 a349695_247:146-1084(-)